MIFIRNLLLDAAATARSAEQKSYCCRALVCIAVWFALTGQAHADLVSGGFEAPDTGPLPTARYIPDSFVPNWQTTASSGLIEIWSNNFNGVSAFEGKQHAELNADEVGMLYQDVSGIEAGQILAFEFAHRARVGTDTVTLTIMDLGVDNLIGGGNDTVLFTKDYSATALNWAIHSSSSEPQFSALGNDLRFAFEAVSTGSGDLTQGNFLDAVSVSVIPEPSAVLLLGLAGLGICFRRRRNLLGASSVRFDVPTTNVGATKVIVLFGILVCLGLANAGQTHADLVNGNFEDPDTGSFPSVTFLDQSLVPSWQTTASTGLVEIWSYGINGVSAYDGKQHAELNANETGTLFQDISGIDVGLFLSFEFAHRARVGTDVLKLTITDLGTDNVLGGGNDTLLFSKQYSATDANWVTHSSLGEPQFAALGNDVRFAFEAVSSGSGNLTDGNFIDAVQLKAVPEPSSFAILLGLGGWGVCLRRRRVRREQG